MSLTALRVMDVLGFAVVGLVTTIGAAVVTLLAGGVARAGLAAAGWLASIRLRPPETGGRAVNSAETLPVDRRSRPDRSVDHALLARQAWWRLRC
jgi:hypothetical protein